MKVKDKLDAIIKERIDYVKELVIKDRCDELYEVIYINFGVLTGTGTNTCCHGKKVLILAIRLGGKKILRALYILSLGLTQELVELFTKVVLSLMIMRA